MGQLFTMREVETLEIHLSNLLLINSENELIEDFIFNSENPENFITSII